MSPSPNDREFSFATAHNAAALEELVGAIAFGQGADALTLLLVRCNYVQLREHLLTQLLAQLGQESLQGAVHVLRLTAETTNLYAQLQGIHQQQLPGAVIVVDTERVQPLETLLVEVNKRREEFRRQFPFPLVLWFTDEGYRQLVQFANDFESVAGGDSLTFTLPAAELAQQLHNATQQLFTTLLGPGPPNSFNQRLKTLDLGYLHAAELAIAVADLQAQHHPPDPALQASLDFAQGLTVANEAAIALFERSAAYWQTCPDNPQDAPQDAPQDDSQDGPPAPLKQGLALFYLGQSRYFASDNSKYKSPDWRDAIAPLEAALAIFEQAQRPDLVARSITQLERVLHRVQRWDQLETVARRALPLHQQDQNFNKLAQDYGFLAAVALHRHQWQPAADLAQQALDTLAQLPTPTWWRILYLKMLAQAEQALGHTAAATAHLQQAQAMGVQEHPKLHSDVLTLLQSLLRQQGRYLEAFDIKQERLAVEKQYGLRAFIGAGRLRSKRTEARPTVSSDRQTLEDIAPEIESSGRYQDLTHLLNRIAGTTHKLIVLHGASGVGKSSLVNGGLLPALTARALENRDNLPLLIRRYGDWLGEVGDAIEKSDHSKFKIQSSKFKNSKLSSNGAARLAEILGVLRDCEGRLLRPVLIFDQFEEFFFANPDPLARRAFFQFVADCLNLPGALKVLFSLREDYIHYLLEARQLVKRDVLAEGSLGRAQFDDILSKQILYEVGNFSPADAKGIMQQLTHGARMYWDPALVDTLVADLAGDLGEVRPIEMQIVGAQLQTEEIQTLQRYRELGEQPKETLVQRYLADVVADCGDGHGPLAELVLFLLTDERGTRPLKTQPELVRELEALGVSLSPHPPLARGADPSPPSQGEPGGISPPSQGGPGGISSQPPATPLDLVLHILCGSGIVMQLPDTPDDRYQLVHDYLAGVIRQRQAPGLAALMAELEAEKRERQKAESEKLVLAEANRKASRRLLLSSCLLSTSFVGALLAVFFATLAVNEREQAQAGTALEQDAIHILSRFSSLTFPNRVGQLEQLIAVVEIGRELEERIQPNTRLGDYAALGPLYTLEHILQNIQEQNRFSHNSVVWSVAFSPDGNQVLTGSDDGNATLWSRAGKRIVKFIHSSAVRSVAFSPGGNQVLTGSDDGNATLWSLEGEQITQFSHEDRVTSVTFSPDGNQVLTGSDDGNATLWSLEGERITQFSHEDGVTSVAFSPDGSQILTGDWYGTVTLRNLKEEKTLRLFYHEGTVNSLVFSPDGSEILVSSGTGKLTLWSIKGAQIAQFSQGNAVFNVAFSPNGDRILTGSFGGQATLWTQSGQETNQFSYDSAIYSVAFSPDGNQILTGANDGEARLWSLWGERIHQLSYGDVVSSVAFSPDGSQVLTGSATQEGADNKGKLTLWSREGEQIAHLNHDAIVTSMAFSPDGSQILAISEGKAILLSNKGEPITEYGDGAISATFSPDGSKVLTGSLDGDAILWSRGGEQIARLSYDGSVSSIAFSPDGSQILMGAWNGTATLWNLRGGKIAQFNHDSGVSSVAFSPNGSQILTGSNGGKATLWSRGGEQIAQFSHDGEVSSIAFSPDGSQILTGSGRIYTGEATLWNLEGAQIVQFSHNGPVNSVAFSPDGNQILTGAGDGFGQLGEAQLRDVPTIEGLLARGCAWLRDYLTHNPDVSNEDRALCNIPPRQ